MNRKSHHDHAFTHTSLLVRDFLVKNNTDISPQPPYLHDMTLFYPESEEKFCHSLDKHRIFKRVERHTEKPAFKISGTRPVFDRMNYFVRYKIELKINQ